MKHSTDGSDAGSPEFTNGVSPQPLWLLLLSICGILAVMVWSGYIAATQPARRYEELARIVLFALLFALALLERTRRARAGRMLKR